MESLTDIIKHGSCEFSHYRSGFLYYIVTTMKGRYSFSIPIDDTGNGTFSDKIAAITLMRWIRKAYENKELINLI